RQMMDEDDAIPEITLDILTNNYVEDLKQHEQSGHVASMMDERRKTTPRRIPKTLS
ncbi:hypothetical protein DFQ27_001814, partial [Actinomortierella ambigua]